MVHDRFEFEMPATAEVVFDTFHYHLWRHRWDSLVHATHVLGGAPCPYVGAVTENAGGGWLARMQGRSFPFSRWAASMRHQSLPHGRSLMVYTYSFETAPRALRWLLDPVTKRVFDIQTRRRFARMRAFLADHAHEVQIWRQQGGGE